MNPQISQEPFKITKFERAESDWNSNPMFVGEIKFDEDKICPICLTAIGDSSLKLQIGNYKIYDGDVPDAVFMTLAEAQERIVSFLNSQVENGSFESIVKQALHEIEDLGDPQLSLAANNDISKDLFEITKIEIIESENLNTQFEGSVTFYNGKSSNFFMTVNDNQTVTITFNYIDVDIHDVGDGLFYSTDNAKNLLKVFLSELQKREDFVTFVDKFCNQDLDLKEVADKDDISIKTEDRGLPKLPQDTADIDIDPYKSTDPDNLKGKIIEGMQVTLLGNSVMPCFIVTLSFAPDKKNDKGRAFNIIMVGSLFYDNKFVDDMRTLDELVYSRIIKIESGTILLKDQTNQFHTIRCSGLICTEENK